MRGLLLRRLTALNPQTEVQGMLCGISFGFPELFPIEGQIAHVLRTRAPCADFLYCYRKLRTRLACVKHAASVRSEPGSNSHVKLAALEKQKSPTPIAGCRTKVVFQANFLSLDSLNSSSRQGRDEVNRTGSGTSHLTQFVKEHFPLSSRRVPSNPATIAFVS